MNKIYFVFGLRLNDEVLYTETIIAYKSSTITASERINTIISAPRLVILIPSHMHRFLVPFSLFIISLPYKIFSHIDSAREQYYKTLYNVEKILVNRKEIKSHEYYLQKQNSRDDSAYPSRTSNEGNSTDNAGGNRIAFVI